MGTAYGCIADGLLAGASGVRKVTTFDVTDHPSQIAGQIEAIPCPIGWQAADFRNLAPLEQLILSCSSAALRDAGHWEHRDDLRIGIVLGLGAEWLEIWETDSHKGGNRICDPSQNPESLVQCGAPQATRFRARRERLGRLRERQLRVGPGAALASSWVGPTFVSLAPATWQSRQCLWPVSETCEPCRGETPSRSLLPGRSTAAATDLCWGRAAPCSSWRRRTMPAAEPARAYAEVAGFGASSDAHNMVIPSPDPEPATAAMRRALADARVSPQDVDYVNAHATSTPVGDAAEARVLKSVFGPSAQSVPVSSTKSMTGHLLTAAAAVEALACLVAIERNALPPTINLIDPDPECNLCHVPNHAREHQVRVAVSNSFGFGGSNTCLVLKAA